MDQELSRRARERLCTTFRPCAYNRPEPPGSHVLIDEDRVSIRVHGDEAGRPRGALVRLLLQLHPLRLQLALQLADVGERGELLGVAVPAGVEGEDVLLEHPLKQPDRVIAVLQDQPVLRGIPGEDLETELLVEAPRSLEILDRQADRKRAEFHALLLSVQLRQYTVTCTMKRKRSLQP